MKTVKRNRRPLNWRQQFTPPLVVPFVNTIIGGAPISFQLLFTQPLTGSAVGMSGPLTVVDWELYDEVAEAGTLPTSAVLDSDGGGVTLTYPNTALPLHDYTLRVPAWSPAFRNSTGAWVAPASLAIVIP